jgi:hypothetical protein
VLQALKHALLVAQEYVEGWKKLLLASKFFLLAWKKFLPVRAELPVADSDLPEEHLTPSGGLSSQNLVASGLGIASVEGQLENVSSPVVLAHPEQRPLQKQGGIVLFLFSVCAEAWESFHPASFWDHCDHVSVHVLVWFDSRRVESARVALAHAVAQMVLAPSRAIPPRRVLLAVCHIQLPGLRLPP